MGEEEEDGEGDEEKISGFAIVVVVLIWEGRRDRSLWCLRHINHDSRWLLSCGAGFL